jgi:sulfur-oxidizing protein SoxB
VSRIDVILGGHTHDAVPRPVAVQNPGGRTLVTNAGSSGKFVAVLDLDLAKGRVNDVRYRLLPVFSDKLKADTAMSELISRHASPRLKELSEKLAVTEAVLYRRGNFNGSVDELICSALRRELDAEIALSPGFRWGGSVLSGEAVSMQDLMSETAMTYPEVYVQTMTGEQIKNVMEDVCDNLFNSDPYYQQGGDMVRLGGMRYACTPSESVGRRIGDLKLEDGRPIEASKSYRVAGWASVNPQNGKPVWDIVANYLRDARRVEKRKNSVVELKGVDGNPGYAGQA